MMTISDDLSIPKPYVYMGTLPRGKHEGEKLELERRSLVTF